MAKKPLTPEDVFMKLDSLRRAIVSLEKAVQLLANRIEPFDDEATEDRQFVFRMWQYSPKLGAPTLENVLDVVREANAHLDAIDRDFSFVRMKIENLERDYKLSEEIKPYLKPRNR